jgi:hypothetical protein
MRGRLSPRWSHMRRPPWIPAMNRRARKTFQPDNSRRITYGHVQIELSILLSATVNVVFGRGRVIVNRALLRYMACKPSRRICRRFKVSVNRTGSSCLPKIGRWLERVSLDRPGFLTITGDEKRASYPTHYTTMDQSGRKLVGLCD